VTSDVILETQGLTKEFRGFIAVNNVALRVRRGTIHALIGPNGAGKTTCFNLLTHFLAPTAGRIRFRGRDITGSRPAAIARMGLVRSFQISAVFPHLTALENVALVARHRGWSRDRIGMRIGELLELTRLDRNLLGRYPTELSGGQKQRVALMRALMLDPDVLLMDEPLGALDPMIRSRLQRDLRAVFERLRTTVLFVTHDLAEAAAVSDEVALLRAGRLMQRGKPVDLATAPADPFVTVFIAAQAPPEALRWSR